MKCLKETHFSNHIAYIYFQYYVYFLQLYNENIYDQLLIHDGTKTSEGIFPQIAKFTGSSTKAVGKHFSSTGKNMIVRFQSNSVGTGPGFHISIRNTSMHIICKNWLDIENQILTLPEDFYNDRDNISCSWLISFETGFHITIEILEYFVSICTYCIKCFLKFFLKHTKYYGFVTYLSG